MTPEFSALIADYGLQIGKYIGDGPAYFVSNLGSKAQTQPLKLQIILQKKIFFASLSTPSRDGTQNAIALDITHDRQLHAKRKKLKN